MHPLKTHDKTDSQSDQDTLKHAHFLDLIIQLRQYIFKQGGKKAFQIKLSEMPTDHVSMQNALTDSSNKYFHFCKGLLETGTSYTQEENIDRANTLEQDPVNEPILKTIKKLDALNLFNSLILVIAENSFSDEKINFILSLFNLYRIFVEHIDYTEKKVQWEINEAAIEEQIQNWQAFMHIQNTETVSEIHDEQPPLAQQETSKAAVLKRETSESDLRVFASTTNNTLIAKRNRQLFIGREELLSDEDITTAIQLLGIKSFQPAVSYFTTCKQLSGEYTQRSQNTWINLGTTLHFRREARKSDSPQVPYVVPFILANWDFDEDEKAKQHSIFQGGHWIALLITVTPTADPNNPLIAAECIDSMSSLTQKDIEYAIECVIRYHEVTSGKDGTQKTFQAFPHISKENLTIKAINTSTQRDMWSCGYMALHTVFCALVDQNHLPKATLTPEQLEFYNCKTSNEKRDFIYKLFKVEHALHQPNAYSDVSSMPYLSKAHYSPLNTQSSAESTSNIDYLPHQIKSSARSNQTPETPKVLLNTLCKTIKEQAQSAYDTFFLTVPVEDHYNLFIKTDSSDTVKNYMNALLAFLSREHKKSMLSPSKKVTSASKKDKKSKGTSPNTIPMNGVEGVAYYLNELIKTAYALPDAIERQSAIKNISLVLREHILEKISDTAADIKVQGNYLHRLMRLLNTNIPRPILDSVEPVKKDDYFQNWWKNSVKRNTGLKLVQFYEHSEPYPSAIQVIEQRIKKLRLSHWQATIAQELITQLNSDDNNSSKILETIQDLSCKIIRQHSDLEHSSSKTLQDPLLQTLHYVETLVFTTSTPNTVRELLPSHLSTMITNFKELAKDTKHSAITDKQLRDAIEALTPINPEDITDDPQQRQELIGKAYQSLREAFCQFTRYNQALQATGKKIPKNMAPLFDYYRQTYQELGYIFSQCPASETKDKSAEETYAYQINNDINQAERGTQELPQKSKRTSALEKFGDKRIVLTADTQSMGTPDIDPSDSAATNPPEQKKPSAHSSSWLRLFMRPFYRFLEWVRQLLSPISSAATPATKGSEPSVKTTAAGNAANKLTQPSGQRLGTRIPLTAVAPSQSPRFFRHGSAGDLAKVQTETPNPCTRRNSY